mmetsp:Transcript_37524/g.99022  ORF Transcript_37524/g.99022 Transcript_37524/m.99022 type:complete len:300 (+) Transcript_37524:454-1353(+)
MDKAAQARSKLSRKASCMASWSAMPPTFAALAPCKTRAAPNDWENILSTEACEFSLPAIVVTSSVEPIDESRSTCFLRALVQAPRRSPGTFVSSAPGDDGVEGGVSSKAASKGFLPPLAAPRGVGLSTAAFISAAHPSPSTATAAMEAATSPTACGEFLRCFAFISRLMRPTSWRLPCNSNSTNAGDRARVTSSAEAERRGTGSTAPPAVAKCRRPPTRSKSAPGPKRGMQARTSTLVCLRCEGCSCFCCCFGRCCCCMAAGPQVPAINAPPPQPMPEPWLPLLAKRRRPRSHAKSAAP